MTVHELADRLEILRTRGAGNNRVVLGVSDAEALIEFLGERPNTEAFGLFLEFVYPQDDFVVLGAAEGSILIPDAPSSTP